MLTAWLEGLGAGVSGFVGFLQNMLTAVVSLFYTPGAQGAAGTLTDFGVLASAALGIGFIFMGLRWITKLLKFNF